MCIRFSSVSDSPEPSAFSLAHSGLVAFARLRVDCGIQVVNATFYDALLIPPACTTGLEAAQNLDSAVLNPTLSAKLQLIDLRVLVRPVAVFLGNHETTVIPPG